MGLCDGIIEIIWRGKNYFHTTSQLRTIQGFTHVGTSVQILISWVYRVQSLIKKKKKDGKDVNSQVHRLKEIVEQNKEKLYDKR